MFDYTREPLRNVHMQVVERIGTGIVHGEIPAGQPLPAEAKLCAMLDVSRTVVREAIRILVGKGLIESRAKSGNRARPPENWNQFDPDVLRWQLASTDIDAYLAKLFDLRRAIEPAAAKLAALAARDVDKSAIRAAVDRMASAQSTPDYVQADIAFHKSIFIATRNEFYWPMAQMFEVALRPSFDISGPGKHRARAIAEHRAILDAIVKGAPEAAARATLVLLAHTTDDLDRARARKSNAVVQRPIRPRRQ